MLFFLASNCDTPKEAATNSPSGDFVSAIYQAAKVSTGVTDYEFKTDKGEILTLTVKEMEASTPIKLPKNMLNRDGSSANPKMVGKSFKLFLDANKKIKNILLAG